MRLLALSLILASVGQPQTKPPDSDGVSAAISAAPTTTPVKTPKLADRSPVIKFVRGQSVYVVAVEAASRDLNVTRADLRVERLAKDQFHKSRAFKVAGTLRQADFVFVVLLDAASRNSDEAALVVSPDDYERLGGSLDSLRNTALWQADNHLNVGRHAALAAASAGISVWFDHPSVVRGLVKQFQRDVIGPSN